MTYKIIIIFALLFSIHSYGSLSILQTPTSTDLSTGIEKLNSEHITIGPKIKSTELDSWLTPTFNAEAECRMLQDIPGAVICVTYDKSLLQHMMGRVSFFTEGRSNREIVREDDPNYLNSDQAKYIGHDIMALDYNDFFAKMEIACKKDIAYCPNSLESDIRDRVIKPFQDANVKDYVVIATAIEIGRRYPIVYTHEILHARFFLNSKYQKMVEEFWEAKVSSQDKQKIYDILAAIYNLNGPNGRLLLLNEFQAYLLADDEFYRSKLHDYVPTYQKDLRDRLAFLDVFARE